MAMRFERDELQYHDKENWNDAYNNKQDNMHNDVNSNDDVDTTALRRSRCVSQHALSLHS